MIAGSEAAAKKAAVCGVGGEKGGRFDKAAMEGRPMQPQPGEYLPPLGPRGGQEAPGKRRAAPPAPIGGTDGRSTGS